MLRRHPHVFNPSRQGITKAEEVKLNWEKIKAEERSGFNPDRFFDEVRKINPSLTQAYKIGKKSREINFDWKNFEEVWAHFKSEVDELELELKHKNSTRIRQELSDVMFTLAQVSRHLGYEPESVAQEGNEKFLRRFAAMEQKAIEMGKDIRSFTPEELS